MPDFPLHFRSGDYRTEQGRMVRAKRAYLLGEFPAPAILFDAFVDTGAPFSVVPATFARQLPWQRLATTLNKGVQPVPAVLSWQGIPCELGTIDMRCIDLASGLRSSFFHLVAKFPVRAAFPSLERTVVLGLNLFDDNDVKLVLEHRGGAVFGRLAIP